MFWIKPENVSAMTNRFVNLTPVDQGFNFSVIYAQWNFRHGQPPIISMHQVF